MRDRLIGAVSGAPYSADTTRLLQRGSLWYDAKGCRAKSFFVHLAYSLTPYLMMLPVVQGPTGPARRGIKCIDRFLLQPRTN
jgi:hypothetical protein